MMNPTRFATLIACSAALCACDKIAEKLHPASEPAASQASAPAASAPKAINVREAFISACLSTASQQAPADDATMQYCGCVYSLRDTNAWRHEKGREAIKIGVKYYGDDDANDANEGR